MTLLEKIIDTFDGEIMAENRWRVDGSNGTKYTVEWDTFHRHYSCGCKGYKFRRRCRHITELSNSFRERFKAKS